MDNVIELAKKYTDLVDEKFFAESKTSDLNSPASFIKQGANAKEILVRKISLKGLGDYSRNSGYTNNKVTVAWETMAFNYDRGTKIGLDVMDNEESMGDTFLIVQNELQTQYVAPEADAFTFSILSQKEGIGEKEETLTSASEFLASLIVATNDMDEAKVPTNNRLLYATPTLLNSIMSLETTKSREVLGRFTKTIAVPQTEFYTKINLLSDEEEEEFGFEKADEGEDINFMIVHKSAVIKHDKHVSGAVIPAKLNPNSDEDISKYRKYGIVYVYDNKTAGIYVSHKPVTLSL